MNILLTTKIIFIENNNVGNLHIKGESNLLNNSKEKIGTVKIDIPNCYIDTNKEIVALSSNFQHTSKKHINKLKNNLKAFSWDRDKEWADSYNYTNYLRLVEKQMNEESKTEILQKFLSENK